MGPLLYHIKDVMFYAAERKVTTICIATVVVSCAWLNPFLDHVQSDALADNGNAEPVPQAFRAVVSRNRDR